MVTKPNTARTGTPRAGQEHHAQAHVTIWPAKCQVPGWPLSQPFLLHNPLTWFHCSTVCQDSSPSESPRSSLPGQGAAPSHVCSITPGPSSPPRFLRDLSCSILSISAHQLGFNQLPGSESSVRTEIVTDRHLPVQLPNLHFPLQLY